MEIVDVFHKLVDSVTHASENVRREMHDAIDRAFEPAQSEDGTSEETTEQSETTTDNSGEKSDSSEKSE